MDSEEDSDIDSDEQQQSGWTATALPSIKITSSHKYTLDMSR